MTARECQEKKPETPLATGLPGRLAKIVDENEWMRRLDLRRDCCTLLS